MSQLSLVADEVRDYLRKEMPNGIEPLARFVPQLLSRIDELERTLIPFARAGVKGNDGKPLIQVYHNDCQTAYGVLSKDAARAAVAKAAKAKEDIPAE